MKDVKWTNSVGNVCYFSEGFNPNLQHGNEILWEKEKKMTREQAIEKARCYGYAPDIIPLLEALELIKFDEEVTAFQVIRRNLGLTQANRIYNDLKDNGFLKCP